MKFPCPSILLHQLNRNARRGLARGTRSQRGAIQRIFPSSSRIHTSDDETIPNVIIVDGKIMTRSAAELLNTKSQIEIEQSEESKQKMSDLETPSTQPPRTSAPEFSNFTDVALPPPRRRPNETTPEFQRRLKEYWNARRTETRQFLKSKAEKEAKKERVREKKARRAVRKAARENHPHQHHQNA